MIQRGIALALATAAVVSCAGPAPPVLPAPGPPPAASTASSRAPAPFDAWHYPSPRCRRDETLREDVQGALTRILNALRRSRAPVTWEGGGAVPFQSIAINDGGVDTGMLHVELVRDAARDAVDAEGCPRGEPASADSGERDERSVDALCQALPVAGVGIIRCSAEGLAALTAEDRRRQRSSPALIYVLAHELSHLVHGDGRSFLPAAQVVDLAVPASAKWNVVTLGCDPRSKRTAATLAYERRADEDAMKVLEDLVLADAAGDPPQDAAVSIASASMSVWIAAESVQRWARRWEHGAMLPRAIVEAPLAPDDAYVRWSVDRVLCDILTETHGYVIVPTFNGTHPSEPERLALISTGFARVAPRFHPVAGALPDHVQEMTARLGGINAVVDQQQRAYYEAFGTTLCSRTDRNDRPDCSSVAEVSPVHPPSCPDLTASLTEQDLTLEPTSLSIRTGKDASIQVDGSVRTALALEGGRLFAGTVSPAVAVIVGPNGATAAWKLPCDPVAAIEGAAGVSVLCEQPFGLLSMNDAGHAHLRVANHVIYDGEAVETGALRGGWFGSVNGVLHATMHLPLAGKSTTLRFDPDGMRSAKPWRSGGCERLFAGMGIFRFQPDGPLFGSTWSSKATSLVAGFDASFERMSMLAHPTGEPQVVACGPANVLQKLVCADVRGALFNPFAAGARNALMRFTASPLLSKARALRGRVCSTAGGLYVQTVGTGGDADVNEVFVARGPKSGFQKVFSDPRPEPELSCDTHGATVVVGDASGSRVLRL